METGIYAVHVLEITIWLGLQLSLPDTVTERVWHSVSVIHISPHNVLLVAIGGRSLKALKSLLHTVLIELSEYNITVQ